MSIIANYTTCAAAETELYSLIYSLKIVSVRSSDVLVNMFSMKLKLRKRVLIRVHKYMFLCHNLEYREVFRTLKFVICAETEDICASLFFFKRQVNVEQVSDR
jgi:hypothetical protein